jgi:hypothetical protein
MTVTYQQILYDVDAKIATIRRTDIDGVTDSHSN